MHISDGNSLVFQGNISENAAIPEREYSHLIEPAQADRFGSELQGIFLKTPLTGTADEQIAHELDTTQHCNLTAMSELESKMQTTRVKKLLLRTTVSTTSSVGYQALPDEEAAEQGNFLQAIVKPALGTALYLGLCSNMTAPTIFERFGREALPYVSYGLLIGSSLYVAGYAYNRRHMKEGTSGLESVALPATGSALFNLGSMAICALTTRMIKDTAEIHQALAGVGTGLALLEVGRRYMQFIDRY